MRFRPIILLVFLLAACSSARESQPEQSNPVKLEPAIASDLPDLGEAPELTNEIWLNTDHPLRLADLRGQVVLLEMWTFG